MNRVDATCKICGKPIRWIGLTPRRCKLHHAEYIQSGELRQKTDCNKGNDFQLAREQINAAKTRLFLFSSDPNSEEAKLFMKRFITNIEQLQERVETARDPETGELNEDQPLGIDKSV